MTAAPLKRTSYPEVKEGAGRSGDPDLRTLRWAQLADGPAAGYIAIAPDLLSGKGTNGGGTKTMDPNTVGQAIRDLPADQITADLNASEDYALKQPASNGRLFVAGFCYGGSQTFRYATNRPDLKAAFAFYGAGPMDDSLNRIKAPV
jgi:carboxymethylenebutenolidase